MEGLQATETQQEEQVVEQVEQTEVVSEQRQEETTQPEESTIGTPEQEPEQTFEDLAVTGVQFGDHQLDFTVPSDAVKMASEKGFDANELVTELFKSKDFSFSPETYDKLTEAYGKVFVDMAIQNLKYGAESSIRSHTDSVSKAEQEAFAQVTSVCGGEEGWAKLEEFAKTLDEATIADFNEAMESGNIKFQQLAVKDLMSRMPKEKQPLNLIGGENTPVSGAPMAISAAEYQASFKNGEYAKDPAKWDALRRAGIERGIQ